MRRMWIRYFAYAVLAVFLVKAFMSLEINPGISEIYNIWGPKIAPNMVSVVLFDFRGYDTLGECIILVSGVLALTILYGRGKVDGDAEYERDPDVGRSSLLSASSKLLMPVIAAVGVYVALGGHISPGGGFQGGSIVAAGFFAAAVLYGIKSSALSHHSLIRMESFGLLIYIFIGLLGLYMSGYYLYNTGTDLHSLVSEDVSALTDYPDGVGAGVIPYLNVAVLIKVSAGIMTALLVIYNGGKDELHS
jgi:energy-converting hydrogenase B subunit I